jgi:hippurate hydrolase
MKLFDDNATRTMREIRHDLHRHPELGFEEHRTAGVVARRLKALGIEVHEGIGGTGVVGVLQKGGSGRGIGLRADMDALAISERNEFEHRSVNEGAMHACGHDGHTTMLLGAAQRLAGDVEFDGRVYFIFQPAEEHGRGALAMMDDGLFERFDMQAVYAIHNLPALETGRAAVKPGPIMACEDNFEIVIRGTGGHAAMPHLANDTIVAGAEVVTALQTIVSRLLKPTHQAVLSVTEFTTDGTRNVLPNIVTLKGDTRAFLPEVQDLLESAMERIVSGICRAHGVQGSVRYSREFAATINSAREAGIMAAAACAELGEGNVDDACEPILASEDFGFMLQAKPGCYLLLGNGGEGPGGCGLHSPNYDFNDAILPHGAGIWVRLVQSQLAAQPNGSDDGG